MCKYIYILNMKGTSYYKIGQSIDINTRKQILQPGNPFQLIMIDAFKCTSGISDSIFKDEFSKYRMHTGGGTEWYDIPKKYIRKVRNKVKKLCAE